MLPPRCAALLAVIACACVGLPPSPPQQGGTSTSNGTTSTSAGDGITSTSGDGTASGADDTSGTGSACGDGVVEAPEECDLGELNGTGDYCTAECTANICGDGYVGPGEGCDDGNQNNEDLCTTECGPSSCGDGVEQAGEACDEGAGNSQTGACLPSCVEASCGDQFIQDGVEMCDSNNIGDQTCAMVGGFSGGVLVCADDCMQFDTSNCFACGDDAINPGEQCDGAQLDGESCVSQGFDDGTLACSGGCTLDTAGCYECGDGVINAAEECDGAQLGGQTCVTQGFGGGTLVCAVNCTYNTAMCCLSVDQPCMGMDALCCDGSCDFAGGTQC